MVSRTPQQYEVCVMIGLLSIALANAAQLPFPSYSYLEHPLYNLEQFSGSDFKPVIMKKFTHFSTSGRKFTSRTTFAPYQAKYKKSGSSEVYIDGLDALYVTPGRKKDSKGKYLQVELNGAARVFILLKTNLLKKKRVRNIKSVQGLGSKWSRLITLESFNKEAIPVGRLNNRNELPAMAIALETMVAKDEKLILPHPKMIKINGSKKVREYSLLFAMPSGAATGDKPQAFPYPASPTSVVELNTNNIIHTTPALPNQKCPDWLHDLYRTRSRDEDIASKHEELMHWRTWHAPIDPIYWCYFDHEHGSYPGHYKPVLDYTAYKTFDNSTTHKRQNESDEGFKVYAIPLHTEQRYLIVTVHIQASKSRRFFARHHTAIFAVFNSSWHMQMELHMKMDFGVAMATLASGKNIPMNDDEAKVKDELKRKCTKALRRFNVINVDESVPFPQSLNSSLRYRMGLRPNADNKKVIMRGMYENWKAPPNTCSFCPTKRGSGIVIDIRNAATAKRTMAGDKDESVQMLSGDSLNRVFKVKRALEIGIEHCHFDIFSSTALPRLEEKKGVFYTDPYFSEVHTEEGGINSLRQFIEQNFSTLTISQGVFTPNDPWSGHYDLATSREEKRRRFTNMEHAILREIN